MGLYKVVQLGGNRREIVQVATDEGAKDREPVRVRNRDDIKAPSAPGFSGSAAYRALAEGIHKKSVVWAERFVERLESAEEVEKIREFELQHPKYPGGRTGVLNALTAKEADMSPREFKPPEEIVLERDDIVEDEDFEA